MIAGAGSVIDRDFDPVPSHVLSRTRCERGGANKNPAVAAFADLEIERQQKVFPLLGVNEHIVAGLVRIQCAVLYGSARGSAVAVHPSGECFAVEEQYPAGAALSLRESVISLAWRSEALQMRGECRRNRQSAGQPSH